METEDVLALVQEVAEQVVTPRFGALASGEVRKKKLIAPVTVADREAEERLTAALRAAYPGALVLGEEAVAAGSGVLAAYRTAGHAFTVDPVDGTRQFVRGSPDHAVMLAELRQGEVVRSWIWQPQHGRAYVAERGAGAWCDGRRLDPADPVEAAAGDTAPGPRRRWVGRARALLSARRRTGTCCGIDYPRLADGAADYAVYWRPRPWDHAPGSLLLTEAGGVVGALDGSPYDPTVPGTRVLVAAADRATYDELRAVLGVMPGL